MRLFLFISVVAVAVVAFIGAACTPAKEVSRESIGKIVDVEAVPTSWNEPVKTRVKTERYVAIALGAFSCPLGVEAYISEYDDGHQYIHWDGSQGKYMIR